MPHSPWHGMPLSVSGKGNWGSPYHSPNALEKWPKVRVAWAVSVCECEESTRATESLCV